MNICIFNGDMSRGGGTERMAQILAEVLSKQNRGKIFLLSLNYFSGKTFFPIPDEVIHEHLPGKSYREKVCGLTRFLRREKIEILIDVDISLAIFSLPAILFMPQIKLISWEMFHLNHNIGSRLTGLLRVLSLFRSSAYICLTRQDLRNFRTKMPYRSPLVLIRNPAPEPLPEHCYDPDSGIIMTAGNFFPSKGWDLAMETAQIVLAKHPDWKWHFYGDGPLLEECKQKIKTLRLEKQIIFCGRVPDFPEQLQSAALYVMTSRSEGFGLVLTEAKSRRIPVIAFDVETGPGEIIEHGISGFLVPPFQVPIMAERICELIQNREKRLDFSIHSCNNLPSFSLKRFSTRWEILLNRITKGKK